MVSKKHLALLVSEYDKALHRLDQAGAELENASVSMSSLGESFAWRSAQAIGELNDLCVRVKRIRTDMERVTTEE